MDVQSEVQPLKSPQKKPKNKLWKFAITATAIAVTSSAAIPYLIDNGDDLSPAQHSKIAENMNNLSPVSLKLVSTNELQTALETIPLVAKEKQQLIRSLSEQYPNKQLLSDNTPPSLTLTDQAKLVWIELWDFATQDGDIVQVSSGGYQIQINLLKSPSRIAVPVTENFIQLTGLADGGGGITVGVNTGNEQQLVIQPGDAFSLPISY